MNINTKIKKIKPLHIFLLEGIALCIVVIVIFGQHISPGSFLYDGSYTLPKDFDPIADEGYNPPPEDQDDTKYIPEKPILEEILPSPNTNGKISLEWNPVEFASAYVIYRSEDGTAFEIIKESYSFTKYTDYLTTSGTYRYKIAAYNAFQISNPSDEQTVVVILSDDSDDIPDVSTKTQDNTMIYIVIFVAVFIIIIITVTIYLSIKKDNKKRVMNK